MSSSQAIQQMRYEKECMERHIASLKESLDKSESKLYKLKEKLYRVCEHEYVVKESIWEMGELHCVKMKCKHCGKVGWKTKSRDNI